MTLDVNLLTTILSQPLVLSRKLFLDQVYVLIRSGLFMVLRSRNARGLRTPFTPHAHCIRPSTDDGRSVWLMGGHAFSGICPHNAIWLADRSVAAWKVYIFSTSQETEPTERTDPQCISGSPHAKSMRSVNGQMQWACGVVLADPPRVHRSSLTINGNVDLVYISRLKTRG